MSRNGRSGGGWAIVGWTALALGLMAATIVATNGTAEPAIRLLLRSTARTSFLLFSGAFVASAVYRLWRNPFTSWLRQNRRYLGVSFALSHALHAAAIAALLRMSAERIEPPVLVLGGLAYLFIAAMTATSFDRTAAWLGPRRWRLLHTAGVYYLWSAFALNFLALAARERFYVPFAVLAAAAPLLRAAAWWRAPRAVRDAAADSSKLTT
jgi:hypothetical protein